jgi:hypothetical protein
MNIRGGYMKGLFIMFIMFSLFISGCELIEEQEFQMNGGPQMSWPDEDNMPFALPIPDKWKVRPASQSTCESSFVGGLCSNTGLDIYAVCSLMPNLQCSSGEQCIGPFDGIMDICGADYSGYGWGDCYCVGDGECHTEFGEPMTSVDCQDCTSGDTQSCNLPLNPGTCGVCNEGLKTCTSGQWGTCEQITFPGQEICDNAFDEDCDCNPDYVDADCLTHLECDGNYECVEVPGEGSNQCTVNADCVTPTHLECQGINCIIVPGEGSNQCTANADCGAPVCGNGIKEEGEECDIDLSSWDPGYAHNYLQIFGHYTNYDLGNCDVCDMGNSPSFSLETCVCAGSYPGDGVLDGEYNLVGSIVSYESCEIDIYPEIVCSSLEEGDCNSNYIQCSWRDAIYIPGAGYCDAECITNVNCYMGVGHNCAEYACPLQEIIYEMEYGSLDNFIWNDIQPPNEESWAAGCGIVG